MYLTIQCSGGLRPYATLLRMKASEKAAACWARNKRRPAYKKIAGKTYWLNGDAKPRVPEGGPKRKR